MSVPAAKISLVVPLYNEEAVVPHLRPAVDALAATLERDENCTVEILLVNDGSRDGTWPLLVEWAAANPRVRAVSLSRNFGHQAALTCGYHLAAGDAVVTMDADLQDPPEVVAQLVREWRAGYDIVYAVRASREGESSFKLWTARWFYRLIARISDSPLPLDAGDFRLLSRRAVDALNALHERHRYLRGLVAWIGYPTTIVRYDRRARVAGTTKFSLLRMLRFAIDATVSFSTFPLRLFYFVGFLCLLPLLGYLAYNLIAYFFLGLKPVPGWTSLIVAVIGLGSLNLLCLGILGEYVGRIYEESKNRPLFIVQQKAGKPGEPPRL